VKVITGEGGVFGGHSLFEVYLDKQLVFSSNKLATALLGCFGLHYTFGVHYSKKLIKTCTFLSAHVMGFPELQLPAVQNLFNDIVN